MADWRLSEFIEVRELGRGAQGRVVLAHHAESRTPVAIKYLARGDAQALAGLRAEAQMLGRLTSPYVARLYRFVESGHGAAIVMEAVNGASLKAVLAEHGALAPEAALLVLKGSLLGLAAAHSVGVVHRDYKPANVVVQPDGLSKLVDFGVAVLAGQGSFAGTPAYMAPEQWRGEPATPATDVYAATCVFVECVTGRRPYAGDGRAELRDRHLTAPADVADVPGPLRPLVLQGMAKGPEERPPGAAAFVAQLESAAVDAYGTDWEQRGVRTLAAAAVALAALFPLGALTVAPGAAGAAGAAGVGSAGAGSAGAGTAGAGSAAGGGMGTAGTAGTGVGKGFLATAVGKGTVAVAGAAVVATSATAAVYAAKDSPRKDPPPVALVNVASQTQTIGDVQVQNAKYVTVGGLGDPALEKRVNQTLRAPLDRLIQIGTSSAAQSRCAGKPTKVLTQAQAGLRGPRLVSVRYFMLSDWCQQADGSPGGEVVTVDLRTGRRLTATDVFRPDALTSAGVARLQSLVTQRDTGRARRWADCSPGGRFTRADFFPVKSQVRTIKGMEVDPPRLSAFLTPAEFRLSWLHGGSDGCGDLDFGASYASVRPLLKPEIAALLPR
ncbi:serine/threonine protein kinase [Actinomadura graeca]|uniref:non-specific serine/threonine protein kinase n=1 Tax=Actinomadura graeca TaxID=2750812 RepID=A0ABX8QTR8_9ACTN|nr:serine/threonine-protein kinase [Actinomadura graeca]QXJ21589.1 serine/threonine protein kinase [Actinomadura graeca]